MPSTTDPPFLAHFSPRGSQDSNGNPTGFSAGASPPLILAFLAIGLFGLSMVGMFGWRRIQFARLALRNGSQESEWAHDERFVRKNKAFGPRPVLWDLRTIDEKVQYDDERETTKHLDQMEEHKTWDTIMPVAVIVTSHSRPENEETVASLPDTRHLYWWPRRTATAPTDDKEKGSPCDDINDNDGKRLQVAVAIAMPSQRIPHDATGARTRTGTRMRKEEEKTDDTFEYTLGLYECAWRRDEYCEVERQKE
ncbi:hypothetical protein H0H87_000871 [Tephrocybe sp. NHM501043]|nr:hypothetical protein H0H87_000871 [Tephrocybe sp. NHM501043]